MSDATTTPVTTTDLYEATIAVSYRREGMRAPATFGLVMRLCAADPLVVPPARFVPLADTPASA